MNHVKPTRGQADDNAHAVALTRAWVERAVIGLGLCPFAPAVQQRGLLRYRVCEGSAAADVLAALCEELQRLASADPAQLETTLLILPHALPGFRAFNDFLDLADAAVADLGLEGVIQIASFHPRYTFAGTRAGDIGNATNRSPHPTLHLLREASVERALAGVARPDAIFEANLRTLQALGAQGWRQLEADCRRDAQAAAPTGSTENGAAQK